MKKTVFVVLFSLFMLIVCGFSAFAVTYEPENDDVEVLYLESLDNGEVLCAKNADMRVAPASITKIVTAIIAIENCENLNLEVKVPEVCISLLEGTNSSVADLEPGEILTLRQLLSCMLVASANDAANVIAHYVGNGDINAFVDLMNQFAENLGCTDTHFVNAHGLDDPEHYTTANDLAKIYRYCLKDSMFSQITGTLDYDIPETNKSYARKLRNTNSLLNSGIPDYYYQYAKGGKTGTTDSAGRCLISWASKDGYNYMCIAMNGKFYDYDNDGVEENMAFVESKRTYDWVFENIRLREVANPDMSVWEIKVRLASKTDRLRLAPGHSVSVLVPKDVDASSVSIEPYPGETAEEVFAPVKRGDVLGKAAVKYAGETIADVELVAEKDISPSVIKYVGHLIVQTVTSRLFIICALLVVLLAFPGMVYLFAIYPVTHRKKRNAIRMISLKGIAQERQNARAAAKKSAGSGGASARRTQSAESKSQGRAARGNDGGEKADSAAAAAKRRADDPFDIGWMPEGMEGMAPSPVITTRAVGSADQSGAGKKMTDPLSAGRTTTVSRSLSSGKTTTVSRTPAAKKRASQSKKSDAGRDEEWEE